MKLVVKNDAVLPEAEPEIELRLVKDRGSIDVVMFENNKRVDCPFLCNFRVENGKISLKRYTDANETYVNRDKNTRVELQELN